MPSAITLLTGLDFGEGPRWHGGRLWLSDFYRSVVVSVDLHGSARTELELTGQPSGLGWLPDGRLLVVSMLDRRVLRREADGPLVLHADLSGVATFHANDMLVDPQGRAYVGNFGFDLHAEAAARGMRAVLADEQAGLAALARVDSDGTVHTAATGLRFPNGMALLGDALVVAETLGRRLTAYDVAVDGSLSGRRVWADTGRTMPDGICADGAGVWVADAAAPGAVLRIAEGGAVLDTVTTTQPAYACALGGRDGRTLFALTAPSSAPARVAGQGLGRVETATV